MSSSIEYIDTIIALRRNNGCVEYAMGIRTIPGMTHLVQVMPMPQLMSLG